MSASSEQAAVSLETEVETLLDPNLNPEHVAAALVKGGPGQVGYAIQLLDRRSATPERAVEARGLKLRLARLTDDWPLVRRLMTDWLGESDQGSRQLSTLIASVARSGDVAGAEALLELAREIDGRKPFRRAKRLLATRKERALVTRSDETAEQAEAFAAARAAGSRHEWSEARRILHDSAVRAPLPAVMASFAAVCGVYADAQDPPAASVRRLEGVDVRYINLDHDEDRRSRIETAVSACGLELIRSPAIRGTLLPRVAQRLIAFNHDRGMSMGTLGCLLSHVRVWELVAEGDRASLILEDDAVPLLRFGTVIERITPGVVDLCFVNWGMSHVLESVVGEPKAFELVPIEAKLDLYVGLANPPGAYGYVLTPGGARKLLAYVAEDGSLGHVDVQMWAYCFPLRRHAWTDEQSKWSRRLRWQADRHRGERLLHATVLYPPLIGHADVGGSTRKRG